MAVGQYVGVEDAEEEGEESGGQPPEPPRPQKDGRGQDHGQPDDGQAAPEEKAIAVVPAIEEALAPFPRPRRAPGEVVGVDANVHEEERHRRDDACQGRVQRVHPMVAQLHDRVARRQMDDLVEDSGLVALGDDGQRGVGEEGESDRGPGETSGHCAPRRAGALQARTNAQA